MTEPHAVRWSRREVRHELEYSKWHWTLDAQQTLCRIPIPLGLAGTFLPDTDDEIERIDCRKCLRILGKSQKRIGS